MEIFLGILLLSAGFGFIVFAFEDLCEDNTIGHGIMQIVPFKERGNRRIKNRTDAMEAAGNFAKYIS